MYFSSGEKGEVEDGEKEKKKREKHRERRDVGKEHRRPTLNNLFSYEE